jgi:hypothetical protein
MVVHDVHLQVREQAVGQRGVQQLWQHLTEALARRALQRRQEAGVGAPPAGGHQRDIVPAGNEPLDQPVAHPLDTAVAGWRDLEPWCSDHSNAQRPAGSRRQPGGLRHGI